MAIPMMIGFEIGAADSLMLADTSDSMALGLMCIYIWHWFTEKLPTFPDWMSGYNSHEPSSVERGTRERAECHPNVPVY